MLTPKDVLDDWLEPVLEELAACARNAPDTDCEQGQTVRGARWKTRYLPHRSRFGPGVGAGGYVALGRHLRKLAATMRAFDAIVGRVERWGRRQRPHINASVDCLLILFASFHRSLKL